MQQKLGGVLLVISATVLFSAHDVVSKYLILFFSVPLLVWARYVIYVLIMLVGVAPGMGREMVVTRRPRLMIFRGLLLVCASVLFQFTLKALPLAEATALLFITPLLVALLAGPMLGEKVPARTWLATAMGFCGVLLICRPGGAVNFVGIACALANALCFAFYQILTRKLSDSEPPLRQLFFTAIVGAIAMSLIVPSYWTGVMPTPVQGLLIVSLGFTAGIGQFLLIRAFHITAASTVSPLLYFQLVWAMLFGWAIFEHVPDLLTTTGMLVIGASCLSLALHPSHAPTAPEVVRAP